MTGNDGDSDHVNRILHAATQGREGKAVLCDRCDMPLIFTGRERATSVQTPMVIITGHCPNAGCSDDGSPHRHPED
ncbi:hypothetical protein [Streptomyces lydicus]|uniref:hypothetical protein n=1 Tax=Streptomyces lydicus TaxID=47763 RepID=UPI001010F450|nr:hypothetical protein [Streptomyces lydicus]MCZ1011445.1 hypothetical protein [Streptomyces lydicus]